MRSEKWVQYLLMLIGSLINNVAGVTGRTCNTELLEGGCPENETCVLTEAQTTGVCVCLPEYNQTNGICLRALPSGGDAVIQAHSWAWTFSILILIAIVIVGFYFMYKFRFIDWVKCKLSQRYNRSFDDVMIGQDDE